MKIVYLSVSTIPSRTANSIHVVRMCDALACNGHDVSLLTPAYRGAVVSREFIGSYYGVDPSFEIHYLPLVGGVAGKCWFGLQVLRALRRRRPGLVYSRSLLACYLASFVCRDVILESHAPVVANGRCSDWLFRQILRRSSLRKLVVITRALERVYLERYPLLSGRIQVLPDGADERAEDRPVLVGGRKGAFKVGYVGHLYRGKGIEVIEAISQKMPEMDFHVVGGLEKDLEFWRGRLRRENVFFHGHVDPSMVPSYIRALDVCLLPNQRVVLPYGGTRENESIADYTSPLKLFEYMSQGKPIVASDLAVLREVVSDGVNGLLCPADDPDAWVAALRRLANDVSLCRRLGDTARRDVVDRYSWRKRAEAAIAG